MKTFLRSILAIALLLAVADATAQGVRLFDGTWDEALAEAARTGRGIYLDAYTSWCGPCRLLKTKILPRRDVGRYFNAHYVSVAIDMEKGEGIALRSRFDVRSYPTHLFFDSDGALVHREEGASAGDAFARRLIAMARDARNADRQLEPMLRRFRSGERSPGLLRRLAILAHDLRLVPADSVAEAYLATRTGRRMLSAETFDVLKSTIRATENSPSWRFVHAHYDALARRHGRGAVEGLLLSAIVRVKRAERWLSPQLEAIVARGDSLFFATRSARDIRGMGMSLATLRAEEREWPRFFQSAVRFIERGRVTDHEALSTVARAFYENVADDTRTLRKAERWIARAIRRRDCHAYRQTQAGILQRLGRKKEAFAAVRRAVRLGEKAGEDLTLTQGLLKQIASM